MRYAEIEVIDKCGMCELGKDYPSHGVRSSYENGTLFMDMEDLSQTMAALHATEYWLKKYTKVNKITLENLDPAKNRVDITEYRTKEKNYILIPEYKEKIEFRELLKGYAEFLHRQKKKGRKITFPINVYFVEVDEKWEKRVKNQNGSYKYNNITFLSSEDASKTFNKKIRNAFGRAKNGEKNGIGIICPLEKVVW